MSVLANAGPVAYQLATAAHALSLTPRFSGVAERSRTANRFSGFSCTSETAEAVKHLNSCQPTQLKWGVNEIVGLGI
jgi:hypothetical protein